MGLAQLDMHWPGFRKARHQVCKRVKRRIDALGLNGFVSYRQCLEADPQQWPIHFGPARELVAPTQAIKNS
jgi:chemotaxis protein methyltransferase CheR